LIELVKLTGGIRRDDPIDLTLILTLVASLKGFNLEEKSILTQRKKMRHTHSRDA